MNRRVAAVRALFEYQVMCVDRADNPVPAPRRGQGLRAKSRGVLAHLGPGLPRGGGRLVQEPAAAAGITWTATRSPRSWPIR